MTGTDDTKLADAAASRLRIFDGSQPEFWIVVTLQFAIIANVNPSIVPAILAGLTAIIALVTQVGEMARNRKQVGA